MTRKGESWQDRATTHRRTILIAGIVVAVVTVGALAGLLVPVRSMLSSRDRAQFETQADLICRDVDGFFALSAQIAAQTPSRSQIREELVAYLQGEHSRTWYREFAEPKLNDAVDASPEMISVFRFDPDGRLLVRARGDGVPVPRPVFDPNGPTVLPETFSWNGSPAFFVSVPIRHPGFGVAGFDIVALTMSNLADRLGEAVVRVPGLRVFLLSAASGQPADGPSLGASVPIAAGARPGEVAELRTLDRIDGRSTVSLRGVAFAAHTAAVDDGWSVAVMRSEEILYRATNKGVALIATVIVVVGALLGLATWWALDVVRERTGAEARELATVVDGQTEQLRELLSQRELLIREVHHRIKNDMGLARSFLRLHLEDTNNPEARQVLVEAESKLAVMSEIYDRLYRSKDFSSISIRPVLERLLADVAATGTEVSVDAHISDIDIERSVATSLSIVVNELATNALKYADVTPLQIVVSLEQGGSGDAVLTVEDNGVGIPQRVIDGQLGFGLTMAKALVEQVDGEVRLADGAPSRVRVILPHGTYEAPKENA